MAKATHTDYQRLQYFFSDSRWDIQALKRKRLEIIQKQRTTASTKDGLLAIDDTGCPKPFARKTEGAKWQYCGPLKREEVCNVGVAAVFVSPSKHFPIDIVPYLSANEFPRGKNDSRFKDKIQIASELFDAYSKTVDFSGTVFDSWYATTRFLTHIHKAGQVFYSEIKSNRNIFMFVVILGKWNKDDDNSYHVLITNKLNSSAKMVIANYLLRWGIEHCFKELKDAFYFDHYQVRHINKIDRYWNLCLTAWTLTYWIKQNAYLAKILETKPTTFNEIKLAVNSILEFASTTALSMNDKLADGYFKIKSKRRKKKCAA
ncbi:MAG: transposase [Planctomycetia bacterium]|nr:transposase [Planctomycetia bacterium]